MTDENGETENFAAYLRAESQAPELAKPIIERLVAATSSDLKQLVVEVAELHVELTFELDKHARELGKRAAAGLTVRKQASPPVLAECFLSFLAPKNSAQAQLGDLQEMFQKNAERFGEAQARRKYWMQVASSFGPLLWQWLKRIGFFTVLIDYFRSKFGL